MLGYLKLKREELRAKIYVIRIVSGDKRTLKYLEKALGYIEKDIEKYEREATSLPAKSRR